MGIDDDEAPVGCALAVVLMVSVFLGLIWLAWWVSEPVEPSGQRTTLVGF